MSPIRNQHNYVLCSAVTRAIQKGMKIKKSKFVQVRVTPAEHAYYTRKLFEEKAKGKKTTFAEVVMQAFRERWGKPR